MSEVRVGDIVRIKSTGALKEVKAIDRAEVGVGEVDMYRLGGAWRPLDEIEFVLRPTTKLPRFVRGDIVECGGEIAEVWSTSGDIVFLSSTRGGVADVSCKLLVRRLK